MSPIILAACMFFLLAVVPIFVMLEVRLVGTVLGHVRGAFVWVWQNMWPWPVVGLVSTLLYGFGVAAMYGEQYPLARTFYFVSLFYLTFKILRWDEDKAPEAGARTTASVLIFVVAVAAMWSSLQWIAFTKAQLAAKHHEEPKAEPPKPRPAVETPTVSPVQNSASMPHGKNLKSRNAPTLKAKTLAFSKTMKIFVSEREKKRPTTGIAEQRQYDEKTIHEFRDKFKEHSEYLLRLFIGMQLEGMRLVGGEMGYCTDPSLPSQIHRCTKELDRIGEQLPSTNPQPSPKFRKDVLKFCTDLRDFEKLFQNVEVAIDKGTVGSIHTAGPEDFARFAAQRQARLEAHADQFRTTYLGKAVDYKNALVRLLYRNGIEVKEELMDQEPTALSKGWVRGADAVPAVADYLEKLLNLLPH